MYCGSCMHDNTLAAALMRLGCDVTLVPVYTPIRTDEESVSVERVFFGGINAYLQQKSFLFRMLPSWADGWLNNPWLIRKLAGGAVSVDAENLGAMTLSALRGEHGRQAKEVDRLIKWLKEEAKPDLVNLTNLLIGGFAPVIRRELDVPVLVTLQGDDLFLEHLSESYREQVIAEMKRLAGEVDGFVVNSEYYAKAMASLLEEPREKFHLIPLGLRTGDFETVGRKRNTGEGRQTIGYLARISPEKGFHVMVDAFIRLKEWPDTKECRFLAAGWLSHDEHDYFAGEKAKMEAAGVLDSFEYRGELDRDGKLDFYGEIDLFSVPATYREPKGLYVLEALASGVPVVQPAHGIFPEMIEQTGGGDLVRPGSSADLAEKLGKLLHDDERRLALGEVGRERVHERFNANEMARAVLDLYSQVLERNRRYA